MSLRAVVDRLRLAYPVALSVLPVVHTARVNPGEFAASDLALVLALVLAATALVYGGWLVLLRRRIGGDAAAALFAVIVFWFFHYMFVQEFLQYNVHWTLGSHWFQLPAFLLASAALAVVVLRRAERAVVAGRFLNVAVWLVLVFAVGGLARSSARAPAVVAQSSLAQDLIQPVPLRAGAGGGSDRDLWLIVPDGYANASVLNEVFGFDNSAFEGSLRALGFRVPRDVRSNYSLTLMSLPSLLNMEHMTRIPDDVGAESKGSVLNWHLMEDHRAARFLKSRGYRFLFFPNAWWKGTLNNRFADWQFRTRNAWDLRVAFSRTELRRIIWNHTPLRFLPSPHVAWDPQVVLATFGGLAAAADRPGPKYVFAHMLMPHRPYLFDSTCAPLADPPRYDVRLGEPADKTHYIGQLQCVNKQLLALVRTILARSTVEPIIIIQGDHGTMTSKQFDVPLDQVTAAQLRERFGAFGAYYLPAGGDTILREPVTIVNVLRGVMRHYMGADLPPRSDSSYFSQPDRPFKLMPLDASQVWPESATLIRASEVP